VDSFDTLIGAIAAGLPPRCWNSWNILPMAFIAESTLSSGTTTIYFPFSFVSFVSSIGIAPQHSVMNLLLL
jgi:hypothetical protein